MNADADAKRRLPLAEAQTLAAELITLLQPVCDRVEIAGSIRRRRLDVGDIELVAVPGVALRTPRGQLLAREVNLLDERCAQLVAAGVLAQRLDSRGRAAWGSRYKRAAYRGFGVDLFAVLPGGLAQFGLIYLIRTGPAEFSHRLVTARRQGGWLPDHLRVRDGALWRLDGTIVETSEEAAVFAAVGLAYVEPARRMGEAWQQLPEEE